MTFAPTKLTPEVCRLCRGAGAVHRELGQGALGQPYRVGQAHGPQEICQRCGGTGLRTLRTK